MTTETMVDLLNEVDEPVLDDGSLQAIAFELLDTHNHHTGDGCVNLLQQRLGLGRKEALDIFNDWVESGGV